MLKRLIKLANHLDSKGLRKEADYLDSVVRKYAQDAAQQLGQAAEQAPEQMMRGETQPTQPASFSYAAGTTGPDWAGQLVGTANYGGGSDDVHCFKWAANEEWQVLPQCQGYPSQAGELIDESIIARYQGGTFVPLPSTAPMTGNE